MACAFLGRLPEPAQAASVALKPVLVSCQLITSVRHVPARVRVTPTHISSGHSHDIASPSGWTNLMYFSFPLELDATPQGLRGVVPRSLFFLHRPPSCWCALHGSGCSFVPFSWAISFSAVVAALGPSASGIPPVASSPSQCGPPGFRGFTCVLLAEGEPTDIGLCRQPFKVWLPRDSDRLPLVVSAVSSIATFSMVFFFRPSQRRRSSVRDGSTSPRPLLPFALS
uniref:Uncharacterized protein TCIL3000_6_310 n=1 Tax=Trypanosoma congolense (strain IL3000) TaxID=1068625 RepID=G0UN45_TRYCI|nr:unnamed protein product [Trypanosoma congolense IL3000]